MKLVSLSVVSHNQTKLIENLFSDLECINGLNFEVILTINIKDEDYSFVKKFNKLRIKIILNKSPRGFGANHNQAFNNSNGDFFCIINPDIRIANFNFNSFLNPLMQNKNSNILDSEVGALAPLVISPNGNLEDSARKFPTLKILFSRIFFKRMLTIDYELCAQPYCVDWVAGMFIIFPRSAFAIVNGFDEKYYMYMEDADICRRLNHLGYKIMINPNMRVIHDAARSSHRNFKYLLWHLRSASRFIFNI